MPKKLTFIQWWLCLKRSKKNLNRVACGLVSLQESSRKTWTWLQTLKIRLKRLSVQTWDIDKRRVWSGILDSFKKDVVPSPSFSDTWKRTFYRVMLTILQHWLGESDKGWATSQRYNLGRRNPPSSVLFPTARESNCSFTNVTASGSEKESRNGVNQGWFTRSFSSLIAGK